MHHQVKLDVFIIRAFALLSETRVILTNTLLSATSSPQTSTNTPTNLTNTNLPNSVGKNELSIEDSNNNDFSDTKNSGTPNNSSSQSGSTPSGGPFSGGLVSAQYMKVFIKISKLYNATLNTGSVDDRSTSPKSSIELYQRFQQIIRELGLSYDASPYAKYFSRIDEDSWKVRSNEELANDNLWNLATMSILNVYDLETGQMIVQGRGKKAQNINLNGRGKNVSDVNSNTSNKGTVSVENDLTPNSGNSNKRNTPDNDVTQTRNKRKNIRAQRQQRISRPKSNQQIGDQTSQNAELKQDDPIMVQNHNGNQSMNENNTNFNNMLFDSYLQQQLQKRLLSVPQDIHSRSLNGYYTQPTSPGANNFEFNFGNDINSTVPNGASGLPFLNSVTSNTTNNQINAALNTTMPAPQHNWKRRSLGSLDVNTLDDDTVEELLQLPNLSNKKTKYTNDNEKPSSADVIGNDDSGNNYVNEGQDNSNNLLKQKSTDSTVELDSIVRQMKTMYESIVSEKGQRIMQLERELELQRQETQWLRKMLIEDMGCVRSMLKDLKR
ncbi:Glycolytic genes transcriptional activator GCR2 [Nakaseomyces glabratus]|uniref:Glycolytic genes transcriptional activator GCR2 n=1 Tax=Candida glabrata TaxID=5478 RepID=A0A0W0EBQ6_CANGB|nr:hypothetical protein J7298_01855 [Nakaseomyces glabratus]KAH7602347.1 hypothetical protein J7295_01862 [Nakaseomyces glabratus]KAH7603347.1 hypothetical protein J7294_01847 [Nakaseomyces glabratus]KAH7606870.1 hypothetical protein J7293_01843 [Nakaseomyces glabratus]KAH7613737.1 hypothetical protein J7292_01837 [Nakaseomyces glabratus]